MFMMYRAKKKFMTNLLIKVETKDKNCDRLIEKSPVEPVIFQHRTVDWPGRDTEKS